MKTSIGWKFGAGMCSHSGPALALPAVAQMGGGMMGGMMSDQKGRSRHESDVRDDARHGCRPDDGHVR